MMKSTAIILGGLGHEKQEGLMDKGYSFRVRVMWWIVIAMCMALMLSYLTGCGFNGMFADSPGQRITGASVNLADQFKDQKAGEIRADRGTIIEVTSPAAVPVAAPTTHPAPVALETPVQVAIGDKTVTAPPGSSVRIQMANAVESVPTVIEHNRSAIAQGASLAAKEPTQGNFDASAPVASLSATKGQGGGAKGSGGTVGIDWTSIVPEMSPLAWVIGLAGLGIIFLALVLWWTNKANFKTPLIVAALGLLLIGLAVVIDKYPLAFVLALFLASILWALWWHSKQDTVTLTELSKGIETASPETQKEIKEKMKASPKSSVIKRVITRIKEG